jgi:hypothetical protein
MAEHARHGEQELRQLLVVIDAGLGSDPEEIENAPGASAQSYSGSTWSLSARCRAHRLPKGPR